MGQTSCHKVHWLSLFSCQGVWLFT